MTMFKQYILQHIVEGNSVQGTVLRVIDRLLSFCWWKSNFKSFGLPTRGLNPGPPSQQAGILPLDQSAA